MAASTKVYGTAQKHLDADVDWVADTIKVTMHSSSYTPNQSTHEFFSSVTNELTTANGYTAGGATLGTKSVTVTGLVTAYLAAATSWSVASGQTLTARWAVVRKDTGTAATSPVLAYVLLDTTPADVTASASGGASTTFTLTWDATDGVFKVTAS
jgi:hypothetical protein